MASMVLELGRKARAAALEMSVEDVPGYIVRRVEGAPRMG